MIERHQYYSFPTSESLTMRPIDEEVMFRLNLIRGMIEDQNKLLRIPTNLDQYDSPETRVEALELIAVLVEIHWQNSIILAKAHQNQGQFVQATGQEQLHNQVQKQFEPQEQIVPQHLEVQPLQAQQFHQLQNQSATTAHQAIPQVGAGDESIGSSSGGNTQSME